MVNVEGSLSADLIAQQNFSAARRGFDPEEVRSFLVKVAAEIVALHERQSALEDARRDAEYRAAHPSFDEETLFGAVGDETAQILKSAHEAAADIRAKGGENASRILKDAHQQAEALLGEAETVLARRTDEAEAVATRIKEAAKAEAERLLDQTRQQAKAIRAQAEAERNAMIEGAQATREKILSALSKKRNVAVAQVEQLRAGRERLLEAYQIVRQTLDQATAELARAETEARAAADAVRHRPLTLDEPDGLDEGDPPTNPTLPIIGRRLHAVASRPTPPPLPVATPAAPQVAVATPASESTSVAPPQPSASPPPPAAASAPPPPPAAASAPPPPPASGSASASPPPSASSLPPASASAPPQPSGFPSASASPLPSAAASASPPASAPPPYSAAPVPVAPALPSHPAAASAPSPPLAPTTTALATPVPSSSPSRPVAAAAATPVASSRPQPTPPPFSPSTKETAPERGATPVERRPSGNVEGLFARIRADRAQAVTHAHQVLDGDESLLQRRDEAIEPIGAGLTRRLKRALQDDQNDLLDRLRNIRGAQKAASLVLPTREAHAARFRELSRSFLGEAITAGVVFTSSLIPGRKAADHVGGADVAAEDLAEAIIDPLRRRLESVLVAGEGDDPVILAEAVGAAYREWKTRRVEAVATEAVAAAFAKGAYAATPPAALLRWLVDDTDGPCPDCDDNALAGEQAKGEPFPTGQRHPPAHSGCRCLLIARIN